MINTELYERTTDMNGNITFKPFRYWDITICGKKYEEIVDILNSLDLERQYDMKLTMENLQKWQELLQKEFSDRLYKINIKEILEENE